MISMIGRKKKLFHVDGPSSNPRGLVEHHYEVYMVWHLLREKPRQEKVLFPIIASYLICDMY